MLRRQCLCRAPRNYVYRAVSSIKLLVLALVFIIFNLSQKQKGVKFHAFLFFFFAKQIRRRPAKLFQKALHSKSLSDSS